MNGAGTSLTRGPPHARSTRNATRMLAWFVIASLPTALIGVSAAPARLTTLLPQLAVAMAACAFWAWLFARTTRRPADPGWFMCAWLFALLLPPATPAVLAGVAVSVGIVLGHQVFGGTGRALVSPALLGVLVIVFGYPQYLTATPPATIPDSATAAAWWSQLQLQPAGALGAASPLACLLGAALLVRVGAASPRTLLGGLAGLLLTAVLLSGADDARPLSAAWHLASGNFAFCLAFIATDPSTAALTRTGRWLHGLLAGALTVLVRVLDPGHPDGVLFAVLLAGLTVPLIDYLVVRSAGRQP